MLEAAELRHRFPGHGAAAGDVAVLGVRAGFRRPEAAVVAMIDRVVALGGEIRRGVVVNAVNSRPDRVEVVTDSRSETFDAVVIAAGPWTGHLSALPLTVERQVLAWFQVEKGVEWLTPDRFPVFFHHTELGDMYGFPTLDGASVKIARHHDGETTDPEAVRRDVGDADLEPLREFGRSHFHGFSANLTRTAALMSPNTPHLHFAL